VYDLKWAAQLRTQIPLNCDLKFRWAVAFLWFIEFNRQAIYVLVAFL